MKRRDIGVYSASLKAGRVHFLEREESANKDKGREVKEGREGGNGDFKGECPLYKGII